MKELIDLIKYCKASARKEKKLFYFIISFTAKIEKYKYFLTPIRNFDNFILSGMVIYDLESLNKILKILQSHSDIIIVDIEKKIHNADKIIKEIFAKIKKKQKIIFAKPNDITVESGFHLITEKLKEKIISNKKITILFYGLGNVGSKLALKLLESNMDIRVIGRDLKKIKKICEFLNIIKFKYNKNNIHPANISNVKLNKVDVVISLLPNKNSLFKLETAKKMKNCKLFLDIGKGGFESSLLDYFRKKNLNFLRLDPEVGFAGFLNCNIHLKKFFLKKIGRAYRKKKNLISGGCIGIEGDYVTDDFMYPKFLYGILDNENNFSSRFLKKIEY